MSEQLLSFNPAIVGKDEQAVRYHNDRFKNLTSDDVDIEGIMEIVGVAGFCTSYILKDDNQPRKGDNTLGARVFQVDFDNTGDIAECITHPFYELYGIGLYSTASYGKIQEPISEHKLKNYTPEQLKVVMSRVGKPKNNFRLVFITDEIVEPELIKAFNYGLFNLFPMADTSTQDNARIFYGSPNAELLDIRPNAQYIDLPMAKTIIELGMKKVVAEHPTINKQTKFIATKCETIDIKLKNGKWTNSYDLYHSMVENKSVACYSPFRVEKNPSAYIYKVGRGLRIGDSGSKQSQFIKVI